jgi:ribosome-associated toxin RatA of RatAB toxin-antitoxin module
MQAQVGIAFAGIRQTFTTRNSHVPGRQIDLALVDGPFSHLAGLWRFTPVGAAGERACKVELSLDYAFRSAALASLVGPVFDKIAGSLVDAFVKRAEQVYGG